MTKLIRKIMLKRHNGGRSYSLSVASYQRTIILLFSLIFIYWSLVTTNCSDELGTALEFTLRIL